MDKTQNVEAGRELKEYVAWLNCGGVAAEDFRALTELAQDWTREVKAGRFSHKEQMAWHRKTHPICRRITKKYPTDPLLFMSSPRSGGRPFVSEIPRTEHLRGPGPLGWFAWFAMSTFRQIVNDGVLMRIGLCRLTSCRRFFHGRTGKRFCSDTCARKHMRQTPEYKKKNRQHQRTYYNKYFKGRRGTGV